MQCWGRTLSLQRCKNDARWVVCHKHRWQPGTFILFLLGTVTTLAAVYHDVWTPLFTRWIQPGPPEVFVEITALPGNYAPDLVVHDVTWKESFQEYRVVIKRNRTGAAISDLQVHLNLPAPVISRSITAHRAADGAGFVQTSLESMGALYNQNISKELFTWFSNHLDITISRLGREGSVDVTVILDYRVSGDFDGFVSVKYEYQSIDGLKDVSYWHPIIRDGEQRRVLRVDQQQKRTGPHKAHLLVVPKAPIIFGPDGTVSTEKEKTR